MNPFLKRLLPLWRLVKPFTFIFIPLSSSKSLLRGIEARVSKQLLFALLRAALNSSKSRRKEIWRTWSKLTVFNYLSKLLRSFS